MTPNLDQIILELKWILEKPDIDRPYLSLAKVYKNLGMHQEADAIMFLVNKRFGTDVDSSDSDKQQ